MRAVLLPLLLLAGVTAAAPPPDSAPDGPVADRLAAERQRLREAREAKAAAEARVRALEARAAEARDAADRTARELDALRGRVAATEADIAAAQARVALVRGLQRTRAARLGERQRPVVELMAGLEARRRRPPVLALLQPTSLDDLVHTRAVLATVAPAVQARTAALRSELREARALEVTARAAVSALRTARGRLVDDQRRLAEAEAAARAEGRALAGEALGEGDRALALGEEAFDIADRLGTLERARTTTARLAALPAAIPRPGARAAPPRAPVYRLPLDAPLTVGLGELSDTGVTAKGLGFRAARGALVRAPAAGRVAFAGPWRRYGRILVIDHGGGWTTLLTGLGALGVRAGAPVAAGQPLARAAGEPLPVTVELRRGNRAMDLLAL